MTLRYKLLERALRPDVLRNLIHPIISVDEYTPKLSDDNIVIMFQVLDNYDAAYDLSAFIERSPENVLDTEATENPNADGRYNVFVEMERDGEFPFKIMRILKDIQNICPDPGWKLQIYGINDPVDVDSDTIANSMKLSPDTKVLEFFDSMYGSVLVEGVDLQFKSLSNSSLYFRSKGIIDNSTAVAMLKEGFVNDDTLLGTFLGEQDYSVLKCGENYLVTHSNGSHYLLSKGV